MYCPNCAAPIDGAKFCRACGTNVSLVPQALTGQLPKAASENEAVPGYHRHRHNRKPASIERITSSFFTGLAFVFVSLAVRTFAPGGRFWWFWLLIPAFAVIGESIGQYLKLRELQRQQQSPYQSAAPAQSQSAVPPARPVALDAPTTSELLSPASVTEHTTRHLDPARPRE